MLVIFLELLDRMLNISLDFFETKEKTIILETQNIEEFRLRRVKIL